MTSRRIIDYAHWIAASRQENRDEWDTGVTVTPGHEHLFDELFFCPFCSLKAPQVARDDGGRDGRHYRLAAAECNACGWWQIEQVIVRASTHSFSTVSELKSGIIREFDLSSMEVPIGAVRREVAARSDAIYDIAPTKMEELVQSVMRDFFACEVHHCGRSGDGGVDLVVVMGDHPILVQVKRRAHREAVERVAPVRELLGATLLQGHRNCAIVTTADHFSRPSRETAQRAVQEGLVARYDLIDVHSFLSMLNAVRTSMEAAWSAQFNAAVEECRQAWGPMRDEGLWRLRVKRDEPTAVDLDLDAGDPPRRLSSRIRSSVLRLLRSRTNR